MGLLPLLFKNSHWRVTHTDLKKKVASYNLYAGKYGTSQVLRHY